MKLLRERILFVLLFCSDLACLILVAGCSIYLRYYSGLIPYIGIRPPWGSLISFLGVTYFVLFFALLLTGAYRMPRRWGMNEAQPVVTKALLLSFPVTTAIIFAVRFSAANSGLVVTPSRFVAFFVWIGLFPCLIAVRLLTGRLLLALYRRGTGLRRAIIAGDGPEATRLALRIKQNPWLGEHIIGRVSHSPGANVLGPPDRLPALLREHHVGVVWLAPSAHETTSLLLPPLLFEPGGEGLIWRVLSGHFTRFVEIGLSNVSLENRELLFSRIRHDLVLPTVRVAMLGSRGAPANYGGVEEYVEEVGSHLASRDAHVAVYCHRKYVSARGMYRGMELRFVPSLRTKHLEAISHTFLATLHALLHEEEIIHYQALGPSTLAWLPRLFGRKIVVTVQGLDWQRSKWGRTARLYLKLGEWTAIHFPHRTIVVSKTLADYYYKRYGVNTEHIPNGCRLPESMGPELIKRFGLNRDSYILFVGRLVPEKGCHILLQAFSRVKTNKQLIFAGRASYEDAYVKQLRDLGEPLNGVQFIGFVKGNMLRELYSNAYIVVHPSEVEGLSISVLEALMYGNCLLVSNIPENVETVKDAGYTFQVGDVQDLARHMQMLIDNPENVKTMREKVKAHVSSLMDWQEVAEATLKQYQSLVDRSFQVMND